MIIIPCSVIFLTRPPGYTLINYTVGYVTQKGRFAMANRYLKDAHRASGDKARTKAIAHGTKSRNAQDAAVSAVVGATYVAGVYTKTLVATHVASRKDLPVA